jgi:DNA-binding MurR/RpiR family transcriptional regulator
MTEMLRQGAIVRLRAELSGLTPALRRVADYAAHNPDQVIYQSVTELAELSGVGEASVIRMCRDLGYKGFQDFKLALAADLASSGAPSAPRILGTDTGNNPSLDDIIAHVLHESQQALSETAQVMGTQALETVVAKLARAERIDIYGVGASGMTAADFAYKLLRLGLTAQAFSDPHLAAMSASNLCPGTVAVGLSRSGSTIDIIAALRLAQAAGAFTTAITHRSRSPLTNHADAVLFTATPESPLTGGAVSSKVGQLLVLDVLFTALLLRGPQGRKAIERTASAVVEKSL